MKKSLFRISTLVLLVAVAAFCKSSDKGSAKKKEAESQGTVSDLQQAEAKETATVNDSLRGRDILEMDSIEKIEAPPHHAPGQEEIDSIKEFKTRQKRK